MPDHGPNDTKVPEKPIFDPVETGEKNDKADPATPKVFQVAEPGRPSRQVEVPSIPFYKSPNVLIAVGGIAAGIVAFCKAFHIPFPFTQEELGSGAFAIVSIGSSVWFLYKRWKYGLDPNSPARRLTG